GPWAPGATAYTRRGRRGPARARGARRSQAEDVSHGIHARRPGRDPGGGAERATHEAGAALRAMHELEPPAYAPEQDRVVADRVPGPQAHHADLVRPARPDQALTGERLHAVEVLPARRGDGPAERQRRAARRVALVVVVQLDDLRIEALAEKCRRAAHQLEQH